MTKQETQGERAVRNELEHLGLEYKQHYRIDGLRYDDKAYREADFYLPKYNVYIEFEGSWNTSGYHRKRYWEKKQVYKKNNLDVIYIYPNNLHYSGTKIKKELTKILEQRLARGSSHTSLDTTISATGVGIIAIGAVIAYFFMGAPNFLTLLILGIIVVIIYLSVQHEI